jgi:hypothetical protein
VSAREATKRVVAATRQLAALQGVITAFGADPYPPEVATPRGAPGSTPSASHNLREYHNTLVRDALNDLTASTRKPYVPSHKPYSSAHHP